MSADSPPSSSPTDTIKETTEKSATFVQWIAELIHRRNWFTLLLLIDVALVLFCTPGGVVAQLLKTVLSLDISQQFPHYPPYFWAVVGLIPVIALVMAVRSMPRSTVTEADISERKAIKGLRPFTASDAEIFAQLQRNRSLRECLEAISSDSFRFGILLGESGCGKTSFLQAGLLPKLTDPDSDYCAVYVRFSDRPPLHAIRDDLAKQLHLSKEQLDSPDLLPLLQTAVDAIEQPLILFFDQFEQFFVHAPRKPDRQPFIQALTAWYHSDLPVRVLVCMRGDMCDRLVELHQALGYALSPQEVFRLEKFSPEEATKVLQVIAETEKLRFEESFVRELTERELADREDGAVSPVDLQILGWMIERQNADELRAFNQQAFQKFGGVEGLMTRFLEKTLEARVIKSQRETAVKVLLALTDLDRNVRAGALNLTELQDKLKDTVKADEVAEAVRWLVRGDVRLVTPEEKAEETTYELAHERLIPAVRKVAGQELTEAQRANELLDRRVNEWLGNQFSSRYLFSPIELWRLKRQQPYLEWGTNRRQKERLWQKSWRRLYRTVGALALVLLVLLSGWGWWLTPTGQRWQMWRELATVSQKVNDEGRSIAVAAFAKDTNFQQADKLCDSMQDEEHEEYKADALSSIAAAAGQLNSPQAVAVLNDVLATAQQFQYGSSKADVLSSIAAAAGQLNPPQAVAVLNDALATAQQIQYEFSKADALSAIAEGYIKLNNPQALEVLNDALATAQQIQQDEEEKANALSSIAAAASQLNPSQAMTVLNDALVAAQQIQYEFSKADTLSVIAEGYIKLNNPQALEVLNDALATAQQIEYESPKADALSSIAAAASQLNPPQAVAVLNDVLATAQQIQYQEEYKANALSSIAAAAGQLNPPQAVAVLNDVLATAQQIQDEEYKANALSSIAAAAGQLNPPQAVAVLNDVLATAQQIQDEEYKANALSSIAAAAGQVNSPQAMTVLNDALVAAQQIEIEYEYSKADVLSAIAEGYIKLNNPQALEVLNDALATAQQIQYEFSKADALSAIAEGYIKLNNPQALEVLNDALATAQQIQYDEEEKANALSSIAAAASQVNSPQAMTVLNDALVAAQQIQYGEEDKANALSAIAAAYAKLDHWHQARQAVEICPSNSCRVNSLSAALTVWVERQHPELAEEEEE